MLERSDRHAPPLNNNQGGRSLIDRVGGHARRGGINGNQGGLSHVQVSQIQAKIDGITGNQPNAMMNLPQGPVPMNGGPMNFTMQEMMMMNWDMMRQMANTLGMLAPMGGFGVQPQMPGFIPQMNMPPPQQQQSHGGMGRGAPNRGGGHLGGRGRGRGQPNQFTVPTQDGPATSAPSTAPSIAPATAVPVTHPTPQPPAPTPTQEAALIPGSNLPVRPSTPSLCKFGLKCTNPQCRYSHPSPVATAESGVVLSTEFCPQGRDCKNKHCTLGHVSPSVVNGKAIVLPIC